MQYNLGVNGQTSSDEGEADAVVVLAGDFNQENEMEEVSVIGFEGENRDVQDVSDKNKALLAIGLIKDLAKTTNFGRINEFFTAVLSSWSDKFEDIFHQEPPAPDSGELTFE